MLMEQKRLEERFPDDETKRPSHVSKEEGDGKGYDILSYDDDGKKIYIDVKTTTGEYDEPIYITDAELMMSETVKKQYHLYRIYNFRDGKGDICVTRGSMARLCKHAAVYKIHLKRPK